MLARISAALARGSAAITSTQTQTSDSFQTSSGRVGVGVSNSKSGDTEGAVSSDSKSSGGFTVIAGGTHSGPQSEDSDEPPPESLNEQEKAQLEGEELAARAAAAAEEGEGEQAPGIGIHDLFDLFKMTTAPLGRLLGGPAYQSSVRKQKKTARFRKGTILDHKAE